MTGYEIFIRKYIPPKAYRDELTRAFGSEWLDWEPETILMEIRRQYGVTPIESVKDKIFALQTFLTTDLFWDDFLIFEKIVLAFNDRDVDHDLIQCATPEELAYAMEVSTGLREKKSFVRDIPEYIRACHREAGVLVYHSALQQFQPTYEDSFRRDVAERVEGNLRKPDPFVLRDDEENPAAVQTAKTLDVYAYVGERMEK
jgi:hypothetical protein